LNQVFPAYQAGAVTVWLVPGVVVWGRVESHHARVEARARLIFDSSGLRPEAPTALIEKEARAPRAGLEPARPG
jgi:hypothetical protein